MLQYAELHASSSRWAPLSGGARRGLRAPSDEGADSDEAAVTELKAYWADAKRLDLGDLSRVAVGFASDSLNDQLSTPNFGARFDAPLVFGAQAEPNRVLPDGSEIKAIDTVVSGLAAQFGEKELGTEVNAARLAHLKSGADKYFVESAFATNVGPRHDWTAATCAPTCTAASG